MCNCSTKLRRGIGRLIDSYAEGMIDKVDFDPRITGLRQRLVNLEDCCKVLRDQAAVQTTLSLIIGRLEDFADHVRDTLSASDWHQRRELIRLLVKRVEIDVDAINIQRARVEGQFARWKQVIGDGLRFHSDEARATAIAVLNRMLDRPN